MSCTQKKITKSIQEEPNVMYPEEGNQIYSRTRTWKLFLFGHNKERPEIMYLCRLHCKQNGYGKLCIYVDSIVNRMDMANYVFMSTPL